MTAMPQPESKSPSRRALLAGALGGIGAWAASAIGRASPARAEGEAIVVGGEYTTATSTTMLTNQTNGAAVFHAESNGSGFGVVGFTGSGIGVYGSSGTGDGVRGYSPAGVGVRAASNSNIGLYGETTNSTGVMGVSLGFAAAPTAKAKTGVYGYANQDNTASAVYGLSPLGVGIRGHSASGYAGYFEGRVYTNAFYELGEIINPAPPLANRARLFVRDNGAGKTQLCVRFRTGGVHIIKTEL